MITLLIWRTLSFKRTRTELAGNQNPLDFLKQDASFHLFVFLYDHIHIGHNLIFKLISTEEIVLSSSKLTKLLMKTLEKQSQKKKLLKILHNAYIQVLNDV